MPSPGLLFLIGAVSAFLGLCLALGLGLIAPKRFAQLIGGGVCGITLVCTGVWLADGGGHG
ncbi:hypothetical protein [Brevundimonas sp.]|jgi:hypothetical protein|uniref:hypothetical protein n=1 Tax=Brevundimonas sp. TaxID=1871086 RepID=UPI00257E3B59|nr:hypothetical protein [Brevundimonas sp.]